MAKSDADYARALDPRPASDPVVKVLDTAEAEAGKARAADRVARFQRAVDRRGGGAGPHTGL